MNEHYFITILRNYHFFFYYLYRNIKLWTCSYDSYHFFCSLFRFVLFDVIKNVLYLDIHSQNRKWITNRCAILLFIIIIFVPYIIYIHLNFSGKLCKNKIKNDTNEILVIMTCDPFKYHKIAVCKNICFNWWENCNNKK